MSSHLDSMSSHLDTREFVDQPLPLWKYSSEICAENAEKRKRFGAGCFRHPSPKPKEGGVLIGRASFVAQGLGAGLGRLLAACSGGGGSSAPDPSTASGLTVSPATISFNAVQNGGIPPTQDIHITISRSDAAFIGV